MAAMAGLLRLRGVSKVYGQNGDSVVAVDRVTTSVEAGEFVALMGPSGCGKSTLLHLMGGMDRPSEGEIWLGDEPLHGLSEEELTPLRRTKIGFVFQFFYLLPTMTVEETVELPLLLAGREERRSRVGELLEAVGMAHRSRARPSTLSGGEMQRVALARALVHDPVLILADEPTGNLDSENGRTVLELLQNICAERGVAVVMATHSQEAADWSSRRLRMRDGRLE